MVDVPIEQYESTIPTVTIPIPTTTSSRVISTAAATTTIPPNSIKNLSTQVVKAMSTAERANVEILDIKSTLEKHRDVLKDLQKLNLHQVIHHQASKISELELINVDTKVRDAVEEQVSFAVKKAMDAPLKARFRDLSTYDLKDLLQQ
jgi:MoxR-like ATPase